MTQPHNADEPREPFDVPDPEQAPEPERDSPEPTRKPKSERVIGGAEVPPSTRTMRNSHPRVIE